MLWNWISWSLISCSLFETIASSRIASLSLEISLAKSHWLFVKRYLQRAWIKWNLEGSYSILIWFWARRNMRYWKGIAAWFVPPCFCSAIDGGFG
jgi:hypothetical protein